MEPTVEATCREELEFECFCPHKQGGGSCTVLFDFSTRRDLRTVYNRADHKHALPSLQLYYRHFSWHSA